MWWGKYLNRVKFSCDSSSYLVHKEFKVEMERKDYYVDSTYTKCAPGIWNHSIGFSYTLQNQK